MGDYTEHLISMAGGDGDDDVCGETFDHAERIIYEDDDIEQWECTRCGAEWDHDKLVDG